MSRHNEISTALLAASSIYKQIKKALSLNLTTTDHFQNLINSSLIHNLLISRISQKFTRNSSSANKQAHTSQNITLPTHVRCNNRVTTFHTT